MENQGNTNSLELARRFRMRVTRDAGFVARIEIVYSTPTGQNVTWKEGKDIRAGQDRTVNLRDTGIPVGSRVTLKSDVRAGRDVTASQTFEYQENGRNLFYETGGGTLTSWLERRKDD